MRYKMLASLVVSAGLVLAISGTAHANGPTSPTILSAGEHWYAYAAGTLYTYKVQRRSDVGGGIPRITTSGWETTFKASPSLIYCTNS